MTKQPAFFRSSRSAHLALAAVLVTALGACSSTPPKHAQLERARSLYQTASASQDVTRAAPLELERARKSLALAEQTWRDKRDEGETSHLSYIAAQEAQVALNIGMQSAADHMVTAAGVEREKIQAQAKAQEAQNAQAQALSANQRADKLERELRELAAQKSKRGMVVVLQDVLFDTGKSELKPGAQSRLDRLASVLNNNPERHILIEGFTDSTGSDEVNNRLSQERADAVKQALTAAGIAENRIQTRGFGEQRPVASNKTASGRQQNRRVEVIFSDANGAFAGQAQ